MFVPEEIRSPLRIQEAVTTPVASLAPPSRAHALPSYNPFTRRVTAMATVEPSPRLAQRTTGPSAAAAASMASLAPDAEIHQKRLALFEAILVEPR